MIDYSEDDLTLAADLIMSSFILNRFNPQFQYHRDKENFFFEKRKPLRMDFMFFIQEWA
jgi:hypothetical protein